MDSDFISSIGHYLGAPDQAIRRCGMLAAEVVASKTGRKLDFGEWEVEGPGKQWSRELRHLIQARDAEAIANLEPAEPKASSNNPIPIPVAVDFADSDDEATPPRKDRPPPPDHAYDSDDSLTGYASSFSSRSPSPTRSELDEIEKDPSLNVGVKKIARPVYLAQLGELLRPTTILKGDDTDEADRIDMGLRCAEELIRRKRDYGSELAENTVNLVHALLALNNNFELDEFDEHRQAALTALVACCPERAAPSVAEEFFRNQYSMDQRFVILKALVFGSRELAGLSVPPSTVDAGRIAFPSKRLPPVMERKYITAADHVTANMPAHGLLEGISRDLIANTAESSGPEPPQLARERQLRIRQPAKVTPLPPPAATTSFFRPQAPVQKPHMTFAVVAAEYFIHPLISRFWTFLRDEQTREARTSAMPTRHQYRGAGTGLILGPTVLGQFVATLGVLIHAARHSPAWGAVLAPDALELALTLGGRRVSMLETEEDEKEGSDAADGQGTHAEVMIAALELALVVLDGSLEFDGGRALGLEHTAVLLGIGEWATKVFNSLDKGERVKGGGGAHEVRLLRAVTGVCLKVDKVSKRWGRSMIQM
jgi:telomere length regulation protein